MNGRSERIVVVRGGYRRVREALERYREQLYHYNSMISPLGFYLKPVHYAYYTTADGERRRYVYLGRYWYRVEKRGGKTRLRYVGREKPRELEGVPDPPLNPLEGLRFARIGESDDILLDFETYEKFRWLFEGLEVLVFEIVGGARRAKPRL